MNENQGDSLEFNRRDFLKNSSAATLLTMLGGVELFAQTDAAPTTAEEDVGPKVKVALIGLGAWGREILKTLALVRKAEIAAICDNYPASLRRSASEAPKATQTEDYKTILANKEIKAVIVATPTHLHKHIVLAALQAEKHVYCEAPLANSMDDARAIALAAKAAPQVVFQAGLQMRSDPQREFLLPFIRSGALGSSVMARAQWHKKQSWRVTSPNPEREKAMNWRLNKDTSVGLIGELGCHQLDQASWFLNGRPLSISGFGTIALWKDGREVPDTVQAMVEFPGGTYLYYDATLANSFDAEYEMFYGSDAAVMLRGSKAWMFKEVDSPLLGWEVYARKDKFYEETGIALVANASKSVQVKDDSQTAKIMSTPLFHALDNFLRNAADLDGAAEDFISLYGSDDAKGVAEARTKAKHRRAAGYLEGYQATLMAIKANEAILSDKRIEMKPEWYKLS